MIMKTVRNKNQTTQKSVVSTTIRVWKSLSYLLLCGFIWLFFPPSVDAFELAFPTAEERDEFVGEPITYQDDAGNQVTSLLTKRTNSEYEYFITATRGLTTLRVMFDEKSPIAFEDELSLPGIVILRAEESPIEMLQYPLLDGAQWSQAIDNVDFIFRDTELETGPLVVFTNVTEETIEVQAGTFETLHVETRVFTRTQNVSFVQGTWLDDRGFPIRRSFRVSVSNPPEAAGQEAFSMELSVDPRIGIKPSVGAIEGGTEVTVTGNGFNEQTRVTIGRFLLQDLQIIRNTALTGTTPPGVQGFQDVSIIWSDRIVLLRGRFRYVPPPTVEKVEPLGGPPEGGTDITITGTGFLAAIETVEGVSMTIVTIGDSRASNVQVVGETRITARSPTGNLGPQRVVVINSDGQSSSEEITFTYSPPPSIDNISPSRGTGGTEVTISGSGFIESSRVQVGDVFVEKGDFVSSGEVRFTVPNLGVDTFPIIVINPDGQESQETINFTYNPPPTITEISPPRGRVDGGTPVTLRGTGFLCEISGLPNIQVRIAGESVEVGCSPTALRFTTPQSPSPQEVDVIVINPDGQLAQEKFIYTPAPIVLSVEPKIGTPDGDTRITIRGEGFIEDIEQQSIQVQIGEGDAIDVATDVSRRSDTEIVARTPPSEIPRVAPLVVIGPDGQRSLEDVRFIYNYPLEVENISPTVGPVSGETQVTITGTGFIKRLEGQAGERELVVTFGGKSGGDMNVESAERITVRTPEGNGVGSVKVTIIGPDGQIAPDPENPRAEELEFRYIVNFPTGMEVYNFPNPTPVGDGTTFRFGDGSGNVEIKIFNMAGELVVASSDSNHFDLTSENTIRWDGKDRFDRAVPFGLYPYVYLIDSQVIQGQLLHIRRR